MARAGRAQWVLRELFDQIGEPYKTDADAKQRQLWSINRATVEDGAAVSWLNELRGAVWYRKPAVLFRALWISRDDIPRNDADRVPTAREAWSHRLLRWKRGGASLISYARAGKRPTEP